MSDEQSIHFLYRYSTKLVSRSQPFNYYPCTLTKRKDKWFLISDKWFQIESNTVEERSASGSRLRVGSAEIFRGTLSFGPSLLEFLCDLLDKDLGMREKVLQDCIIRYDAIVQGKVNHSEEITTILSDFQTAWHQIHPYFTLICCELLRDELISHFHNNYFKHLEEVGEGEGISITSSLFNSYIKDLTNYITPFTKEILGYDNDSFEIYIEKLKRYLLGWISNCWLISKIQLPSPTQTIYDAISFLEASCDFLNRYKDDLSGLSDIDRFSTCVKIFATDQLKDSCNDFAFTNNGAASFDDYLLGDIHVDETEMRYYFQNGKMAEFESSVPQMVSAKLDPKRGKTYRYNFQSIVFIALWEMLSNTVVEGEKVEKRNTFILKCKYCGQHFIQPRSNSLYCSRTVEKYQRPCSEVGPKIKYSENMSLAEKARHKIVNRFSSNIKRAGGNTGRMRTLTRNREEWNKMEEECRKQLEDGEITAEEYIEKIENAYKEVCKST